MIELEKFKIVVENTPLVSIDFIVRCKETNEVLLGKRNNNPAKDFYFTLGGRILKDETILIAQKRIFENEFGFELDRKLTFVGVFEHFYDNSFFENFETTHYVNLAYEVLISLSEIKEFEVLPKVQHDMYKWFYLDELLSSQKVHKYVKNYFNKIGEN